MLFHLLSHSQQETRSISVEKVQRAKQELSRQEIQITIQSIDNNFSTDINTKKKSLKNTRRSDNQIEMNDVAVGGATNFGSSSTTLLSNAYYNYVVSPQANKDFESLKIVYELSPKDKKIQYEMTKYYTIKNDQVNKLKTLKKLKRTLSDPVKEYAYNLLQSIELNGLLVTYGEKDTYPLWVLQELDGVRTDVTIINYDLLLNKEYRKNLASTKGININQNYTSSIAVIEEVANKTAKPVYYSLGISPQAIKSMKANLYATGLAFKYSKTPLANGPILAVNWEKKFNKKQINKTSKSSEEKKLEMNYILPLIQLVKYYKSINKTKELQELKTLVLAIANRNGKKTVVEPILKSL